MEPVACTLPPGRGSGSPNLPILAPLPSNLRNLLLCLSSCPGNLAACGADHQPRPRFSQFAVGKQSNSREWHCLRDHVHLEVLFARIGADESLPANTALKDLEALMPSSGVGGTRAGVAAYRDGRWRPGDTSLLNELSGVEGDAPPRLPEGDARSTEAVGPDQGGRGSGGKEPPMSNSAAPLPGSQVRGRMTLREVSAFCQVPIQVIAVDFGLPEDVDVTTRLSSLTAQLGIEVQAVRDMVDRYQEQIADSSGK
jgi:hypothetical protein